MPAPGHSNPTALPFRIRGWLADHPGAHRARDVANGLGRPEWTTQGDWSLAVARALSRLLANGSVTRQDLDIGHKKPVGHYALAAPTGDASA